MDLQKTRETIDSIDSQLVSLFEERLAAVDDVARYKDLHKLPILDVQREKEVVAKHLSQVTKGELKEYVEAYIQAIMNISKSYQKNIMRRHIFLVGMPGAGKTTVGKALAETMGMEFYDLDSVIQETTGKALQNIIIYEGEPAFRKHEYEVIEGLLRRSPSVIATGGGTVLSKETNELMKDAGIVVFVHRDVKSILDDLDLEIRPLIKESIEYIFRLYKERYPLYEEVSSIKVENATTVGNAVSQIVDALPGEYK